MHATGGACKCLTVLAALHALQTESMFFIADTDKEKEDWINAIGRAIVKHSRRCVCVWMGGFVGGCAPQA